MNKDNTIPSSLKEEILKKHVPENCYWENHFENVPMQYIHAAMEEYAAQQLQSPGTSDAVEFAEWLTKEDSPYAILWGGNPFRFATTDKDFTTKELYALFLQSGDIVDTDK